ncbi:UNVERIFIED_ORG: hypothetical protein J3D58_000445 [Paenarthrobacter nicotinovorans]
MDMETIRLIGVGVCTLLAGVFGAGITAFVTLRNSRRQREEERFTWKREKLLGLVSDALEAGRELDERTTRATKLGQYLAVEELWNHKFTMYRLSEHFMILDSGTVSNLGWEVTMMEIHRLNALDHSSYGKPLKKPLEEWSRDCRTTRTDLITAMKLALGDPTMDRKTLRKNKKELKQAKSKVELPEKMSHDFYVQSHLPNPVSNQ